jgi:transposase
MDARETRGRELATAGRLRRKGDLWIVPSQSGRGSYAVDFGGSSCSCPDHEDRGGVCKHLWAVQFTLRRELHLSDGTTITETKTVTVTKPQYPQNAPAYNAAQTHEKDLVMRLLYNLVAPLARPDAEPKKRGRPCYPLSDVIFACAMKVYGTISGRRSMSDMRNLEAKGLLRKAMHYNSIFNYFDDPKLEPILRRLITDSAIPLCMVEQDWAADATGFCTSTKDNWFEAKHEGAKQRKQFVKLHALGGTFTHVIASVDVTEGTEADCPRLPLLMERASKYFRFREVSADKAYLSNANLACINQYGATPFIQFKVNSTPEGQSPAWERMYHHMALYREDFQTRYNKRSNIEAIFHMIKSKFRDSVRSKCFVAQRNEVLFKVLLHNLCVLVQMMYEFKLEPFLGDGPALAVEEGAA